MTGSRASVPATKLIGPSVCAAGRRAPWLRSYDSTSCGESDKGIALGILSHYHAFMAYLQAAPMRPLRSGLDFTCCVGQSQRRVTSRQSNCIAKLVGIFGTAWYNLLTFRLLAAHGLLPLVANAAPLRRMGQFYCTRTAKVFSHMCKRL